MKSDQVKTGMQQAPHRSLFHALGFTEEEMKKPMVGIVSSYNEIVPGHINCERGKARRCRGRRRACGVPGDCSLRRYRDGPYWDEIFPRNERSDCGLYGMYGACASV